MERRTERASKEIDLARKGLIIQVSTCTFSNSLEEEGHKAGQYAIQPSSSSDEAPTHTNLEFAITFSGILTVNRTFMIKQ